MYIQRVTEEQTLIRLERQTDLTMQLLYNM